MLTVTMDVFSGRANPRWLLTEEAGHDVLRRVAEQPTARSTAEPDWLGFRGLMVEITDEDIQRLYDLPSQFRLAVPSITIGAEDLVERMLGPMSGQAEGNGWHSLTSPDEGVDEEFLRTQILDAKRAERYQALVFPPSRDEDRLGPDEEGHDPLEAQVQCRYETYTFSPPVWNAPQFIRVNNCYNFATAMRTNTFAQPGRGSGHPQSSIGCLLQGSGALYDGAVNHPNCATSGAPRMLAALVIWPGQDYHWYRQVTGGTWGHKPGQTAARNTDNAGRVITNPYTCARAPYTAFCGWYYLPRTMRVR